MAKFKVTTDHSWVTEEWQEWFIEAETAAKAKYKCAKLMGYGGENFICFIRLFLISCEQIDDNSRTGYSIYYDENKKETEIPF